MRSQKKTFIQSLALASIAFGGMLLYDYFAGNSIKAPNSRISHREILIESVRKLSELWKAGKWDAYVLQSCPRLFFEEENYSTDFLKCNSHYLHCLYKDRSLRVEVNKKAYSVKLNFTPEVITKKNKPFYMLGPTSELGPHTRDNGLYVSVEFNQEKMPIRLRSDCHSLYLPQGDYGQTLGLKEDPYRWSNRNRDLFFDKFLVRKRDVLEFYEQTNHPNLKEYQALSMKELSLPSDSLTEDQMHQYCAYQGKTLMKAHIFDAIFYHPGPEGVASERMLLSTRSPYPWSWRKGDSHREKILKGEKKEVTLNDCKNLYSLECLTFQDKIDPFLTGLGWSGGYMGLGVISEFTENSIEPRRNTLLSSKKLSITSHWHQLGARAYWNGRDHDRKNFSYGFENFPNHIQEIPVGFRCMREVF